MIIPETVLQIYWRWTKRAFDIFRKMDAHCNLQNVCPVYLVIVKWQLFLQIVIKTLYFQIMITLIKQRPSFFYIIF